MYEASFMSTNTVATLARKIAHHGHPEVGIRLHQHNNRPITYTTADSLSGEVSITAPHTARFDEVEITLQGLTLTHVENMTPVSTNARLEARHPFLKLAMPIPESDYPQPRIAEAGQTYKFPFNFVIPQHLLPTACKHACVGSHVHEAHLHLPPSMGDREVSPSDDLSPDMIKIVYVIRVRVLRNRERDGKIVVLTDRSRKIRVIPAIPEAPPMHIPADDKEYTLSVTKQLRRGMFAGKLGKITASASQTKALAAPSPSTTTETTIMATLKLRFDPSEINAQPPRLGSLTSKIKSTTFYAVRPLSDLASRSSMLVAYDLTRGVYSTGTSLATRCVENVAWTYHHAPPPQSLRRDSGYSSCSSGVSSSDSSSSEATITTRVPPTPTRKPSSSSSSRSSILGGVGGGGGSSGGSNGGNSSSWYEAHILVPLTLPATKTWLPTFHSCLASRIYSLDMCLAVHTPGTGVPSTSISLRLPVQISSGPEGMLAGSFGGAADAAELEEEEEVEDYLRPRIISVPGEEFVGGSTLPTRTTMMMGGQLPPSFAESEGEGEEVSPLEQSPFYMETITEPAPLQQPQQQQTSQTLRTERQTQMQLRAQSLSEAPPGYEMLVSPRWGVPRSGVGRRGTR